MMLGMFRHQLSTNVRFFKTIPDKHLIYTVDLLKEKARGYLEANDTAQACEKTFQGCKLALIEYIKKLETTTDVKIVPEHLVSPWNYSAFKKLCVILMKTTDPGLADELNIGWSLAYRFHIEGWTQNNLTVEEVKFSMPHAIRFMDIVERELRIDLEMAMHLKDHLFKLDLYELANAINKQAKSGQVGLLLQTSNMRKHSRVRLYDIYKRTYDEDLFDVSIKNKNGFKKHFSL